MEVVIKEEAPEEEEEEEDNQHPPLLDLNSLSDGLLLPEAELEDKAGREWLGAFFVVSFSKKAALWVRM